VHRQSNTISPPLRNLAIGGFNLSERIQPPDWTLLNHAHETPTIGIVLQGSCTEIIGKRYLECVPRTLQVVPAGENHALKFGNASVRCLMVEVNPQRHDSIRQFSSILDYPLHIGDGRLSPLVFKLYREFRTGDDTAGLTLEGLLLEILGDATRHQSDSTQPPPWLRLAREIIHENAVSPISLTQLANRVGVHPTYLARIFRRFYHDSVGQYVQRLRVDHAVRLLLETESTLAEIASAAGFYDQSHFSNVFKLHQRMTPSEFRQTFRPSKGNPNSR
jgi:AraC family transcriptional regulator